MRRLETIIVGGGPAGAATACGLADLGREALLIERAGGPHHKVCGEFLSIETQSLLRRLNVEPAALGAAAIDRIAVYAPTRAVTTALPFRALSLSRYRLDDALLRCAESHGAQVRRNVSVRSVTPAGNGWTVSCDDDATLHSRNLVLATGKWGMRGLTDARDNSMVGLKMHLRLAPHVRDALANRVELALLDRGYAGLELHAARNLSPAAKSFSAKAIRARSFLSSPRAAPVPISSRSTVGIFVSRRSRRALYSVNSPLSTLDRAPPLLSPTMTLLATFSATSNSLCLRRMRLPSPSNYFWVLGAS
jgi:FAD binding domain